MNRTEYLKNEQKETLIHVAKWIGVVYNILLIIFTLVLMRIFRSQTWRNAYHFTKNVQLRKIMIFATFIALVLGSGGSIGLTIANETTDNSYFEHISLILNLIILFSFFWLTVTCIKDNDNKTQLYMIMGMYMIGAVYIILQMIGKF